MWMQVGVGAGLFVVLLGSVVDCVTKAAAAAEPKPLVILARIHVASGLLVFLQLVRASRLCCKRAEADSARWSQSAAS
jgi:hypothetical protein